MKNSFGKSDIPPLQHNSIVYYLPEEKADLLNKYFTDISKISEEERELPALEIHIFTFPLVTIT